MKLSKPKWYEVQDPDENYKIIDYIFADISEGVSMGSRFACKRLIEVKSPPVDWLLAERLRLIDESDRLLVQADLLRLQVARAEGKIA